MPFSRVDYASRLPIRTSWRADKRSEGGGPGDPGFVEHGPGVDWSNQTTVTVRLRENAPPVFMSAGPFTVDENETTVGTVTATDADPGDTYLRYAITGGADRYESDGTTERFEIDAESGALSFKSAPNYEDPQDDGADNVYEVEVEARSGTDTKATAERGITNRTTQPITVTVADVPEQPAKPAKPTLAAVADSTTSLRVNWTKPDLNGGPEITGYNVAYREYATGTDGEWTALEDTALEDSVTAVTAIITGLSADTEYEARVQAENGELPSDWSEPSDPFSPKSCALNPGDLWCGVVTVAGVLGNTAHGFVFDEGDLDGNPEDEMFLNYTINSAFVGTTGSLDVILDDALSDEHWATLELHVEDPSKSFAFSTASTQSGASTYTWPDAGLDWSSESTVTLRLRWKAAPTLSIADARADEGGAVAFTVTLSEAVAGNVTVDWTASRETDDTAESDDFADLSAATGTLTFAAKVTGQTITVATAQDADKDDETFTVTLSNPSPSGVQLADATATGTIRDDDRLCTLNTGDVWCGVVTVGTFTSSGTSYLGYLDGTGGGGMLSDNDFEFTNTELDSASHTITGVMLASGTLNLVFEDAPNIDEKPVLNTWDLQVVQGGSTGTFALDSATVTELPTGGYQLTGTGLSWSVGDTVTLRLRGESVPPSVANVEVTSVPLLTSSGGSEPDTYGAGDEIEFTVTFSQAVTVTGDPQFGFSLSGARQADYRSGSGSTALKFVYTVQSSDSDDDGIWIGNHNSGTKSLQLDANDEITSAGGIDANLEHDRLQVQAGHKVDGSRSSKPTLTLGDVATTEGGGVATIPLVLSAAAAEDVTVTCTASLTSASTAEADDFTLGTTTGTVSAGQTQGSCTVALVDDTTDEPDETFTVTLSDVSSNAQLAANTSAKVTIQDDDDPPTLSVNDVSGTEGTPLAFTVTLSAESEKTVTVDYATSEADPQSAVSGTDFTAASGTLTFSPGDPGDTTKTITVATTDDTTVETNETFTLTLSSPANATLGTDTTATGTIVDDDATVPTLSVADAAATEGSPVTFTVTLSAAAAADVTATWTASLATDDTAETGDFIDLSAATGTLTITASQTTATVTVATKEDTTDEDDETFTVTLSSPSSNAEIATDATAQGTIEDDDDPPTLSVEDASATEGDAVEFTVEMAESGKQVTVAWAASAETGDSATAGTDFTAATGTLTFSPGTPGDTAKTVTVATAGDTTAEDDETFTLTLSDATNATLPDPATATGTIEDSMLPVLSVGDASATEGSAVALKVKLSVAGAQQVTVDWAASAETGDTAVAGTDFTAVAATALTFTAGDTEQTVTVATALDTLDEEDETFTVRLSNPTNATLASKPTAEGKIDDDDDPPVMSVEAASALEGEDVEFTVKLSPASGREVTVAWEAIAETGDTAGTGDFTEVDTSLLIFTAGQTAKTLTVATTEDTLDEEDETFTLTLSEADNAGFAGGVSQVTAQGKITDDDPEPTLSVEPASAAEGEGVEFTVKLAPASGRQVTVDWAASAETGDTAGAGDFTAVAATALTFTAGQTEQTVTVSTTGDMTDEPDETFTLTLSDATNATLPDPPTAQGTITDDDGTALPALSVADAEAAEGSAVPFIVRLSAASAQTVTVDWVTLGLPGNAFFEIYTADASDYVPGAGTLTFAAGETVQTVSVQTLQDTAHEEDEPFGLLLSNPTNAVFAGEGNVVLAPEGTIVDDDDPPVASVDSGTVGVGGDVIFTLRLSPGSGKYAYLHWKVDIVGPDMEVIGGGAQGTASLYPAVTEHRLSPLSRVPQEVGEVYTLTFRYVEDATAPEGTSGSITVVDTTALPAVTIAADDASVTEESGEAGFTLTRTAPLTDELTVTVELREKWYSDVLPDGMVTLQANFDRTVEQTVTFAANAATAALEVPLKDDELAEGSADLTVTVKPGDGYTVGDPASATVTVTDASDTGAVQPEHLQAIAGPGVGEVVLFWAAPLRFYEITRHEYRYKTDGAYGNWQEIPDSGQAPDSLTAAHRSGYAVTGLTGGQTHTFEVRAVNVVSGTPTASDPSNEAMATPRTAALEVSFGESAYSVDEGGTVEVTVRLGGGVPGRQVTVPLSAEGAGGATAADWSGVPESVTFGALQTSHTFTLTATDDADADAGESVELGFGTPLDGVTAGTPSAATVTIVDDDGTALPALSIADAEAAEGYGVEFTVTLSATAAADVTATWTASLATDDTAETGDFTDLSAATGTLTITASQTTATVTVATKEDTTDEENETFTVTLSSPSSNARIATDATAQGTIEDDDAEPTLSVGNASATEGSAVTFTVKLSPESGRQVTVDWAASAETGDTAGTGDFTAVAATTLTFTAGQTEKAVTVSTSEDTTDEENETFTLTLSDATNATLPDPPTAEGTITDDDDPPKISVQDQRVIEGNQDPDDLVNVGFPLRVMLSEASGKDVRFMLRRVDLATDTATDADVNDPTGEGSRYRIAAGETSFVATHRFPIQNDTLDEPDETFTLEIHTFENATAGAKTQATITIEDDDDPPTLGVDDASATEGDAVEFTVTLDAESGKQVTVAWAASAETGDSATAGTDFTAATGTLTFSPGTPGDTAKTVTVATAGDTTAEDAETFTLTLSDATNATLPDPATATGTIEDSMLPVLSVGDASATEGSAVALKVKLSVASEEQVTVDWAASKETGDTAVAGTDFTAVAATALTFTAGDTEKTVTVATALDTLDEEDETFTVRLSNPTNATLASNPTAKGKIDDDDDPPVMSVEAASALEGEDVEFTVKLSPASGREVTVGWEAIAETGDTAGTGDFTEVDTSLLIFTAGQTAKTLTVATTEDTLDEEDETFTLTLSVVDNAGFAGGVSQVTAQGKITDDDDEPTLSVEPASAAEGGGVEFTVKLAPESGRQVTVDWATSVATGDTAVSGTDFTAANGTLTFAAGDEQKTFTVSTTEDLTEEEDETFTLTLSGAVNAGFAGDATTVTATGRIDDDDGLPDLSVAAAAADEGAGVAFTVSLSEAAAADVTATWTASLATDDTAETGDFTDLSAATGTLTITASQTTATVTVATKEDTTDEEDETFTVTLSSPSSNAELGTSASAQGTIRDDDDPPAVSFGAASYAVDEGGSVEVAVVLSARSGREQVEVPLAHEGEGGAALPDDYSGVPAEVTFAAGETEKRFTIEAPADAYAETGEGVALSFGTLPDGATAGSVAEATVSLNDVAVTVSFEQAAYTAAEGGSNVAVALTLTPAVSHVLRVMMVAQHGEGATAADYSGIEDGRNALFTAGQTRSDFDVTAVDDALDEADETVTFGFTFATSDTGLTAGSVAEATLTLTDDDPEPTLSVDDASANEGEAVEFTVKLDPESGRQVTVDWAASKETDDTAVAGTDFTADSGTLTFSPGAPGETAKTLTVSTTEDLTEEDDETFTLTLSSATNADFAGGATTVTAEGRIDDDDGLPALSIGDAEADEGYGVAFTVTLSEAAAADVTATWTASLATDDTAETGDFTDLSAATGTLTITASNTTATVTVATKEDTTDEDDETFTVTLSSPSSNAQISDATAQGTIDDDDAPPTISIAADVRQSESANVALTVNLSAVSEKRVKFRVRRRILTTDTASEADLTDFPDVVSYPIAPGQESATVTSSYIRSDTLDEPDETFTLQIHTFENATAGAKTQATITIEDDDPEPSLSVEPASAAEGEDVKFTVELAESGKEVTVKWAASAESGDTAIAGTDFTAVAATTLTFTAGQTAKTLTVATTEDTTDEQNETFTLTLSDVSNATLPDPPTAQGTIRDDDKPVLRFAGSPVAIEDSAHAKVILELDRPGIAPIEVHWEAGETSPATAVAGVDFEAATGTVTFAPGDTEQDFRIRVINDNRLEDTEKFLVTLRAADDTLVTLAKSEREYTIADLDDLKLSLDVETVVDEDAGAATVTVYADAAPVDFEFRFDYETQPGIVVPEALQGNADYTAYAAEAAALTYAAATEGADYRRSTGTLTFGPGAQRRTITVPLIDDGAEEERELFQVWLVRQQETDSRIRGPGRPARVVIEKSDLPVLSIGDAQATEGDPVEFTVRLSPASGREVTVDWAASAESGDTAGTGDFTAANGALTFTAGQRSKTVRVATTGDSAAEEDETFTLRLSNATNATLGNPTARGTIRDDDAPPPVAPEAEAVAGSYTSLEVRWGAPDTVGGLVLTGYELRYGEHPGGAWNDWPHAGIATAATITGLQVDTAYQVEVRAVYGELRSVWVRVPGSVRTAAPEAAVIRSMRAVTGPGSDGVWNAGERVEVRGALQPAGGGGATGGAMARRLRAAAGAGAGGGAAVQHRPAAGVWLRRVARRWRGTRAARGRTRWRSATR